MKLIILLNKSYFCCYKSKILKQILVFLLCSLLLVVQGLSAYNLYITINEKQNISNGVYDAAFVNLDDIKSELLLPVEKRGKIKLIATAENKKALYNNKLNIGYMDSNATKLSYLKYINGHPPKEENDIVLEKGVFSILRQTLTVGDTLVLEITSIDRKISETVKFKISGIVENYSVTQWKMENSETLFPQILVSEKFLQKSSLSVLPISLLSFLNDSNINDIKNSILQNEICDNYFFNELSGTELELEQFVSVGSIVLVIFSGVFAVFILINNLMLKRQETRKKIGLYKIIGMKKREIVGTLLLRDLPNILIGCILGDVFGSLILGRLYPIVINEDIIFKYEIVILTNICLIVFYLLLVIIELVSFLNKTVSDNIKQNDSNEKIRDIKTDIENPLILWAWKNFNINRAASTTLSLLIMIAILFSVVGKSALNYVDAQLEMSSPADIEVVAYNGATTEYIGIPDSIDFGVREEDLAYLYESDNVSKHISLKNLIINIEVPLEKANSSESRLWYSDEYKKSLRKYGYNENIGLHNEFLIGADESALNLLENQKNIRGNINYNALNSAEEVILCNAGGAYSDYKVGDVITVTQIINNKKYEFSVTVGAIIDFGTGNYFESMEALAFGDRIVWGVKSFDKLGIELNYNHILLSLKNSNDYEDVDTRLMALNNIYSQAESNNQFKISENFQQAQLYRSLREVLSMGCTFVLLMILLFVFTSSAISIKIRLEQQSKVLASMRAMGLTQNNLFLIILYEKLCELIFSFGLGTVLSSIFIILFNREMGINLIQFPYLLLCVLILIISAILFVISYVFSHSFFKKTIAEQIHLN